MHRIEPFLYFNYYKFYFVNSLLLNQRYVLKKRSKVFLIMSIHVDDLVIFLFHIFSGMPESENFAFVLNTLLSDIALYCPTFREEIFEAQTNLLITLCKILEESKAQPTPLAANTRRE